MREPKTSFEQFKVQSLKTNQFASFCFYYCNDDSYNSEGRSDGSRSQFDDDDDAESALKLTDVLLLKLHNVDELIT